VGVVGDRSPARALNLRLLNKIRAGVAATAAVLAFGCGSGAIPVVPTPVTQPTPPPRPMAVIISVDGLRPDSLSVERTPNILDMAGRGTACWQAQTTFPPITLPSHASMLTGYPPSIHGLTWGDYQPARGNSKVPTIFSYARAAGMRTVMVVGKDKLNHLRLDGSLDAYDLVGGDDEAKVNDAIVQIQAGAELLLVHLPDVDGSGHNSGWMSDRYLQQVAEADRAIGRLLSAIPRHATVLLTADHGGLGPTHGVDRVQDMTIPWIVLGPDIQENHVVGRRISTMDTAATILDVLGLSLASNAVGRPVTEAYKPESSAARRHLALR
jgi:predicted AlkP superfamily pyrophosphatase or phosphodiesterase